MDTTIRKKLWNVFYSEILSDILITGHITSSSLKTLITNQYTNLYATLLIDLKTFFDTADLENVQSFFHTVMEESFPQQKMYNLINTIA